MSAAPVPPGYRSVIPYLAVAGAARAIAFCVQAFGGREGLRLPKPDGTVGHAEIEIGDSLIMLADPWPEGRFLPPARTPQRWARPTAGVPRRAAAVR